MIVATHRSQLRVLLVKKPDLTLKELREAIELKCSLQAIHVGLAKMGLTYITRHIMPANKIDPTLRGHARRGSGARGVLTRHD